EPNSSKCDLATSGQVRVRRLGHDKASTGQHADVERAADSPCLVQRKVVQVLVAVGARVARQRRVDDGIEDRRRSDDLLLEMQEVSLDLTLSLRWEAGDVAKRNWRTGHEASLRDEGAGRDVVQHVGDRRARVGNLEAQSLTH